jgi:hypothetical protein
MKFGARVYQMKDTILVTQTELKGTPPEYVISLDRNQHIVQRHAKFSDDKGIVDAVKAALAGKLRKK